MTEVQCGRQAGLLSYKDSALYKFSGKAVHISKWISYLSITEALHCGAGSAPSPWSLSYTNTPCVHIRTLRVSAITAQWRQGRNHSNPLLIDNIAGQWNPSDCMPLPSFRSGGLVSHGDWSRALAPGGPPGADGGDGCGHTGTVWQLGLGQQLPAALQRHGPGLETVQARGRCRGESHGCFIWSAFWMNLNQSVNYCVLLTSESKKNGNDLAVA